MPGKLNIRKRAAAQKGLALDCPDTVGQDDALELAAPAKRACAQHLERRGQHDALEVHARGKRALAYLDDAFGNDELMNFGMILECPRPDHTHALGYLHDQGCSPCTF